jgi:hypothetical protein
VLLFWFHALLLLFSVDKELDSLEACQFVY